MKQLKKHKPKSLFYPVALPNLALLLHLPIYNQQYYSLLSKPILLTFPNLLYIFNNYSTTLSSS